MNEQEIKARIEELQRTISQQKSAILSRGPTVQRKKPLKSYRNQTLVMNNDKEFVSKVSRSGMSLVNSDIHKTKQQAARKSVEAKRRKHMASFVEKNKTKYPHLNRIVVAGDKFVSVKSGNRLLPVSMLTGEKKKLVMVNGTKYLRLTNGGLKPVKKQKPQQEICRFYSKTGMCQRGTRCKFSHAPEKLGLCRMWGKCFSADCHLSHQPSEFNSPSCKFYQAGNCTNEKCPYTHKIDGSLTCREFAVGGSCSSGRQCQFAHNWDCPDSQEYGFCHRGKSCKLNHLLSSGKPNVVEASPAIDYDFIKQSIIGNDESEDESQETEDSDSVVSQESEQDLEDNADYIEF